MLGWELRRWVVLCWFAWTEKALRQLDSVYEGDQRFKLTLRGHYIQMSKTPWPAYPLSDFRISRWAPGSTQSNCVKLTGGKIQYHPCCLKSHRIPCNSRGHLPIFFSCVPVVFRYSSTRAKALLCTVCIYNLYTVRPNFLALTTPSTKENIISNRAGKLVRYKNALSAQWWACE